MKTTSIGLLAGSMLFASIFVGNTVASATTYSLSDGDFTSATQTLIYQSAGTASTISVPCSNCGNGGGAGIGVVDGTANTAVFIGEPNWTFDPATVISLSGSIDKLLNFSGSISSALRLAIEQDGNYYFTSLSGTNITQTPSGTVHSGEYYTLASNTLTLSDFGLFTSGGFTTPGGTHPNSTDSIELGYLILIVSGLTTSAAFDNLNYAVTATPLPAALPLFATGIGVMGLFGWRRKRKAVAVAA
jgi:hypothetical protein